jgi:hypothetical protein
LKNPCADQDKFLQGGEGLEFLKGREIKAPAFIEKEE